jgi:hypothetical protein
MQTHLAAALSARTLLRTSSPALQSPSPPPPPPDPCSGHPNYPLESEVIRRTRSIRLSTCGRGIAPQVSKKQSSSSARKFSRMLNKNSAFTRGVGEGRGGAWRGGRLNEDEDSPIPVRGTFGAKIREAPDLTTRFASVGPWTRLARPKSIILKIQGRIIWRLCPRSRF